MGPLPTLHALCRAQGILFPTLPMGGLRTRESSQKAACTGKEHAPTPDWMLASNQPWACTTKPDLPIGFYNTVLPKCSATKDRGPYRADADKSDMIWVGPTNRVTVTTEILWTLMSGFSCITCPIMGLTQALPFSSTPTATLGHTYSPFFSHLLLGVATGLRLRPESVPTHSSQGSAALEFQTMRQNCWPRTPGFC